MTERARREYAEAVRSRYEQADKRERERMLDEYCRATALCKAISSCDMLWKLADTRPTSAEVARG